MRDVQEWIGSNPDSRIPPRVRLRIFDRFTGRCQCGCGIQIRPGDKWELDHIVALINAGEHRESNLRPLLTEHHKGKTAEDVAEKSKVYERRKRDLGIKKRSSFRGWRKMNGEVKLNPNYGVK